ncbi:MAG: exonuclease domain-containing protein [Bacteroidia bacterium]|nr:exonuclease domain-containing protein [Bacteroidia bacterium]
MILHKPLCFIDIESTGLILGKDRIIQLAALKLYPDMNTEVKSWMVNPEMPIPPESTRIHGIKDEDVNHAPAFREVAGQIASFIGDADLAGYNSNRYDVPMLVEEFYRAGVDFSMENRYLIDVQYIFNLMEPRNLAAAYAFYCGKKLEDAHNAEADVRATYEVFLAQIEKYRDTEIEEEGKKVKPITGNIKELGEFFSSRNKNLDLAGRFIRNENNQAVFNFGKYKGQTVEEVFRKDTSYYHWMMNGNFSYDTKNVLTRLYLEFKNNQQTP